MSGTKGFIEALRAQFDRIRRDGVVRNDASAHIGGPNSGRSPNHVSVTITTNSGKRYTANWAKPAPTEQEALEAWDEDTMGGSIKSGNWKQS